MRGGHVTELLAAYQDGTLTPEQRNRIKTHIIFCHPCRQAFDQVQAGTPKDPATTPTHRPSASSSLKTLPFPVYGALAACLLFGVGGVVKMLTRGEARTPHKLEPAVEMKATSTPIPVQTPTPQSTPLVKAAPPVPVSTPNLTVATPAPAPVSKPFQSTPGEFTEVTGDVTRIHEPMTSVIDQPLEWSEFWKKHAGESSAPPAVNFDKFDILAIFPGPRPVRGYTIKIDWIEKTSWEGKPARIVHYRVAPPQGTPLSASSHPFLITRVSKLDGDTFFRFHP
jgi:hypothetical protein